jgi:AraC-like DNA-binding protein
MKTNATTHGSAIMPDEAGPGTLAPWQATRVRQFIEQNLELQIRVSDLSGLARLSTSHFSRAFRRSFAMAPHQYVLNRRIERAKRLMAEEGMPMSQVALVCGFADQSHLCRRFAKAHGTSPVAWLRFQAVNMAVR